MCDEVCDAPFGVEGMIFLKKIFDETKTSAEPNAHSNPIAFEIDIFDEHARMTPKVRGKSEMYVFGEYLTPKSSA